jgi:hypothetical protein
MDRLCSPSKRHLLVINYKHREGELYLADDAGHCPILGAAHALQEFTPENIIQASTYNGDRIIVAHLRPPLPSIEV